LIHALVSSRLDYANAILQGVQDKQLKKLQSAQNAAARVLARVRKREHITPVLRRLHWLPIRQRVEFKVLLLAFKALNNQAPSYIRDLLTIRETKRTLRSSDKQCLVEPIYRLESYGVHAFSCSAPRLWNRLPDSIRAARTSSSFKDRLKPFLFERAYGSTD